MLGMPTWSFGDPEGQLTSGHAARSRDRQHSGRVFRIRNGLEHVPHPALATTRRAAVTVRPIARHATGHPSRRVASPAPGNAFSMVAPPMRAADNVSTQVPTCPQRHSYARCSGSTVPPATTAPRISPLQCCISASMCPKCSV